jgi:opacity protein-like surface antigen
MRIRVAIAVGLLLATQTAIALAQRTGDRARLVFTISGSYINGKGLWTQPESFEVDVGQTDIVLGRSIQSTIGAALGATYYPRDKLGFTVEGYLLGLGFDDACRVTFTEANDAVATACANIDDQEKSAAAAAFSVGAIYRIASRDWISPFARASAGLLFTNQSSIVVSGTTSEGALLPIYEDDNRSRVRPAFGLGVGASMVLSRGYHLRWEVRDNILGVERVTGPVSTIGLEPPHETDYKHLFSVLIGIDVILERQRGRRY